MTKEAKASVKLTGPMRDGIVSRACAAAFDKEKDALAKRETALARRCYDKVIPAAIRKQVEALPAGWLRTTRRPSFNVGGLHIEFASTDPLRVSDENCGIRLGSIADAAIIAAVTKFQDEKKDYLERRRAAAAATKALVESCASTKQLREIWPQGEAFYSHIEPAAPVFLPATQIKALNEMLGIKRAA